MIEKVSSRLISVMPDRFRYFYYYRMLRSIAFPEIVHIENTNACNAKCIICARDSMKRRVGFMDFNLFKRIIDECSNNKELKKVHLHGFGEPLMDERLLDRIQYTKQKGIKEIYFVTNGSLLTKEYSKALLEADIDAIKFSVYGNSPQTFEAIHKGLKYQVVEKNIRDFFEIRKKMNRLKPRVKIQFLEHEINTHEKAAFFNKWSSIISRNCGDIVEEVPIHNWIYSRYYQDFLPIASAKKSCGIPFISFQILWNGNVTACCYDFDGKMKFGNVRNMTISDIWNGAQFRKFRTHHRRSEYKKLNICNICDQLR